MRDLQAFYLIILMVLIVLKILKNLTVLRSLIGITALMILVGLITFDFRIMRTPPCRAESVHRLVLSCIIYTAARYTTHMPRTQD